jgi:hypothetical protein
MHLLFLFLDGIGLGIDDPQVNPFAGDSTPRLAQILGGKRLVASNAPHESKRATLLSLDARLGVEGFPQSATGQAVLLTGQNVPAALGYHYGPKPNPPVAEFLNNGNLFRTLNNQGLRTALLSAYPPRYFEAIQSGRRMYSAIPLAATSAGNPLMDFQDLAAGRALAADFTALGWREHLGLMTTPTLTPEQAGLRLAELGQAFDFSLFEYWLTDYAGHGQDMNAAKDLLSVLDRVVASLVSAWQDDQGLILITSDHGNLEDLSTRRHTLNPVPAILIGDAGQRRAFSEQLTDLTGVAPKILSFFVA